MMYFEFPEPNTITQKGYAYCTVGRVLVAAAVSFIFYLSSGSVQHIYNGD